jgi:hypothetical protein
MIPARLVPIADLEARHFDRRFLALRFRSSVAGAPSGPGRLALELTWLRKARVGIISKDRIGRYDALMSALENYGLFAE